MKKNRFHLFARKLLEMNIIISFVIISSVLANNTDDISFQYGILGKLDSQDNNTTILQDSSLVHSGDYVRINAGYNKNTYLYVIYKGSVGEFMLLYPEDGKHVDNVEDLPETIYTTVLHWSQLSDPTGDEIFYLINSSFVLEDLTSLFKRYDKTKSKGKMKLAKKIQYEIDDLDPESKQELASLESRLDKPVVGGVAFRGDDEDGLRDMSLTHSCSGEFGIAFKKILLNHK